MDDINPVDKNLEIEQSSKRTNTKPALTIVIHTWATPIVGVLMLAFGLIGGFFGRPLLSGLTGERSIASSGIASSSDVTADPQDQPANPDELMAYVVDQTRHFIGDPNAPVTIIEFSDFQ